jgi:hypothetical protein
MQKKYPKPRERGERWRLWDDREVTVLERLKDGFVKVIAPNLFLSVEHEKQFRLRLEPKVEGDKHESRNS